MQARAAMLSAAASAAAASAAASTSGRPRRAWAPAPASSTDSAASPQNRLFSIPTFNSLSHPALAEVRLRVRTAKDEVMPAPLALEVLKAGNRRFVAGTPLGPQACISKDKSLEALATKGQSPLAAVIGCADSRCPVEILFDALPGDIFVLRNAGNTCTHAEGSIVGSTEFCVGHLRTKLIVVLGHTACGAINGATATYMAHKASGWAPAPKTSALDGLLQDLRHVAQKAEAELPKGATTEEIAAHAVKVNVFSTMDFLMSYSQSIRDKVRDGEVEVHGAIYNIETGEVEFLGKSPNEAKLLQAKEMVPPSMGGSKL